ncbi:hypothetical protein GCM10020008_06250 [Lentilactobacillus kefiri DSM 20587 = JCM 5818]|uniref:Uncharacterized protein n=1 Tax=Lentilactobacillus kefiri TaxID=33962 RepID=A0A511DS17_LENKE|nr:hypothetical protein LKE01_04650 [Lentilactobacillus kefiri]
MLLEPYLSGLISHACHQQILKQVYKFLDFYHIDIRTKESANQNYDTKKDDILSHLFAIHFSTHHL